MINRLSAAVFALLGFGGAFSALAQNTVLVMDSDPGDFIGQGQSYYYTPAEFAVTAQKNFDNGVSVSFSNGSHNWRLDFAAPDQAPLQVQLYENATRFPFQAQGTPGLDVSGDGRGCNELTGQFEVKQIVYGSGDTVVSFHATFVQHCEGAGPALTGEVLFNSSAPLPPKNHITSALTAFGTQNQPFLYRIRASNSPTSFTASNLPDGLSVNTKGGLISGTPTVQGNFLVSISATGSAGTASNTLNLTIDPPGQSTGAYTALFMTSDNGDFVGQGQTYFYKENDGNFSAGEFGFNSVGVSFSTPDFSHFWNVDVGAPTDSTIGMGIYREATRFASSANPSLDVFGDGRGCNETSGSFEVKKLAFENQTLTSFRATFEQHCEEGKPALRGEVWFHSMNAITSKPRVVTNRDQPFSYQIVANNQPTSYGASALPPGLSINAAMGVISGTPTLAGKFSVPLKAIGPSSTAKDRLTLVIRPPDAVQTPLIGSSLTATGTSNQAFSYQIRATHSPTQFSATRLPSGLSVDTTTGLIFGTPTVTGTFNVIITASNSSETSGRSLTLSIYPPIPVITSPNHATGVQGQQFKFKVTATNRPDSFSASGLPDGLTIGSTTGLISGAPNITGTFFVTVRAENGSGIGFQMVTLNVN